MRQFVLGLSVMALAVWLWSGSRDVGAATGGDEGRQPAPTEPAAAAGAADLDLGAVSVTAGSPAAGAGAGTVAGDGRGGGAPNGAALRAPAEPTASAARPGPEGDAVRAAFAELVRQVVAGDQAARERAAGLLLRDDLWPEHRAELQRLLGGGPSPAGHAPGAPPAAGDDFASAFARLGSNNAFLHTQGGRAQGMLALQLATALPDPAALDALTALLDLCMRGPIAKADTAAKAFVDKAYGELRPRADRVICDPADLTSARSYTIQKGDSLAAVAARFRKEVAIDEHSLAILNRIHNVNRVNIGQRIKVPLEPIHAIVEKRSFLMAVYVGPRMLRLYWIGHGADGKTPCAEFVVKEKLKDPEWYAPDGGVYPFGHPKNILGRYFLKFEHPSYTGFGAHGTPLPETIGTQASMGCIRMYDQDIEELFRLLPRNAKVLVRDSV